MDFSNEFSVTAPLSLVWSFLLNAQEVAPCVPGAQITEIVDETHFKGTVKVKLGAVQMTYRGELHVEPDEEARTIVLHAKGTETRGSGGAAGTSTARLTELENGETHVEIVSQVDVSGRVAQFGRGIMQDVANRIMKEFSACLEAKIQARIDAESGGPTKDTEQVDTSSKSDAVDTVSASQEPALTAPPAAPAPASVPSYSPPAPATELRVSHLVWSITRSRLAAGLRFLADRLEPK